MRTALGKIEPLRDLTQRHLARAVGEQLDDGEATLRRYVRHRRQPRPKNDISASNWPASTSRPLMRIAVIVPPSLEPRARPRRAAIDSRASRPRSEEHTSELQSLRHLVCRLLLEKKKENKELQQLQYVTCQ